MYPEDLQKYVPPEFDLAKYDKCRNMDLIEWIVNISSRMYPYLVCTHQEYEVETKQRLLFEQLVDHNILRGAITDSPSQVLLEEIIKHDVRWASPIVREMNFFDLFNLNDVHKTEDRDKLYSEINTRLYPLIPRETLGELDKPIQSDCEDSWLRIEMGASKREIQEAFTSWLDKAKKEQEILNKPEKGHQRIIKNFNDVTFRKWFSAKVLPYIDLVTWNHFQGNKLNDTIITSILFINEKHLDFEPINFLRLTTRPHVKKIMSPETVRRMLNLYSMEKCKEND